MSVLFRLTGEALVAPAHAGELLALCDAVATFRPLPSGRSREVLGRLRIVQRLPVQVAAGADNGGGDGSCEGVSEGSWLAPPPRSSLYRIAEASCCLVGVGAVTVDGGDDER